MEGNLWINILIFGIIISNVESWSANNNYPPNNYEIKCERLTVSMCSGLRYNLTAMPNFMGHRDQIQAEQGLTTFMPLLYHNCSKHIRFFLCAVFVPVCSEHVPMKIPACKSLCLSVRRDCEPALSQYSLPWPNMWDCERFSDSNSNALCVQPPSEEILPESLKPILPMLLPTQVPLPIRKAIIKHQSNHQCPPNFVKVNNTSLCAPHCGADAYYRSDDKKFATRWMTGWAFICFLSTLFTLLTYWVEPSRFRYPELPIVFLALSYNLLSILYIIRGLIGPKILSCASQIDGPSYVPVQDGLQSISCAIWWLLKHYLSLASSFWWTILCGCWLLSAKNEWSSEALQNIAIYFHSIAWILPIFLVSGSLISRNIVADELTGLCQISDESALWLKVLPHGLLLLLGSIFGIIAGISLIRVRRAIKNAGRSATKLERLMTRLGIFGILYALPALVELICALHESSVRPKWREFSLMTAEDCRLNNKCIPGPVYLASGLEVLLLRIFLSLFVGVTSGMWVWSGKTCRAWSKLITAPSKPIRQSQTGPLIGRVTAFQGLKSDGISGA